MKTSRNKGEPITPANLRSKDDTLKLPEGHFAQGLRVTLDGSASGFATLPGSRVDIIQTVRKDGNASYSQILLSDVLVLAADLKPNADGELASPAQVVTFALTGEDVLKVALAKELGIMTLALRNFDERDKKDRIQVVTVKDITPDLYKKKEAAPVANA